MTLDHRLYVTVQARLMKGQVMDGLKALTGIEQPTHHEYVMSIVDERHSVL